MKIYKDCNFEIVFFKLLIEKQILNFVSTYNLPSTRERDYLDYLELLILSHNLNNSWYLIGDLNLDLLSLKGKSLHGK